MKRLISIGLLLGCLLDLSPKEVGETAQSQPAKRNAIQVENAKPGSTDWQLTRVKLGKGMASFRTSLIEGYCSHQSVQAGDTFRIMVSTAPAAKFKIEIRTATSESTS